MIQDIHSCFRGVNISLKYESQDSYEHQILIHEENFVATSWLDSPTSLSFLVLQIRQLIGLLFISDSKLLVSLFALFMF